MIGKVGSGQQGDIIPFEPDESVSRGLMAEIILVVTTIFEIVEIRVVKLNGGHCLDSMSEAILSSREPEPNASIRQICQSRS